MRKAPERQSKWKGRAAWARPDSHTGLERDDLVEESLFLLLTGRLVFVGAGVAIFLLVVGSSGFLVRGAAARGLGGIRLRGVVHLRGSWRSLFLIGRRRGLVAIRLGRSARSSSYVFVTT